MEKKYAIVTGGSRGVGLAITKRLVKDGFSVLICSRNENELIKTAKEIDPTGKKIKTMVADVSTEKECKKIVDFAIQNFKHINVLVNNAGIYGPIGFVEDNSMDDWKKAIEINLFGTVMMTKYVLPHMKKEKNGKIINLAGAGVGGSRPLARFSAYFTSKMAVTGFTEVIAAETVEDNIQVNCISPGAINTKFTDFLLDQGVEKAGKVMYEQALKTKKDGGDSPELGANLVSFLASSESNHITGKILSAKWDTKDMLKKLKADKNIYTLRRIDNELFNEKK